jgi:glycosyltransferase involved in cell wall biosynthesis
MKIVAIEYFPTTTKGGSEKAFFEVLAGLKNLGHEITVFYVLKGDLLLAYDKLGINHKQLPKTSIQYFNFKSWFNLVKSARLINNSSPDIIYINQLSDSVLASLCKLLRKVFITCHIRVPKTGNSRLFNLTGRLVDYFICVNHLIKAQYSNNFELRKIMVVNDGIKIPPFETLSQIKTIKSNTATYLGRISPEKGLTELLDTWQILNEKYNLKIRLDITGPADSVVEKNYKQELIKNIAQRKLSSLIHFKGPIHNPVQYFQSYDLSVFPSIWPEPFGRTIPESILGGTPVFARNVGIVNEILAPAKKELVYEKEKDLAEKIFQFYQKKIAIDIKELQKHILKNYDIDKNVLFIENILKRSLI